MSIKSSFSLRFIDLSRTVPYGCRGVRLDRLVNAGRFYESVCQLCSLVFTRRQLNSSIELLYQDEIEKGRESLQKRREREGGGVTQMYCLISTNVL